MASAHEHLLLKTPKKPTLSCKILFFTASIFLILISATFLTLPKLITRTSSPNPSYLCHKASNPQDCQLFLSQIASNEAKKPRDDDVTLLQKLLMQQVHHMNLAISNTAKAKYLTSGRNHGALSDCLVLLSRSVELVLDSIRAVSNGTSTSQADARAWLSGVLTNHDTCSDGLVDTGVRESVTRVLEDQISRARASLAILAAISPEPDSVFMIEKWPSWIRAADRQLLQSTANAVKADLTVAKDGSGNYKTVKEAIAAAPSNSKTRYVIYVKKGTYKENVEVGSSKKNMMIIGDGMDSTIITGSLNVVDGATTFNSATLAAVAEGFILQDICIQNTAGPEKHQAVALRVGSDKSVINRCLIDAYQDTLYAHSLRQFYRDSYITGTVDFIFGNAAVVFQKCNLIARKPMKSQKNMVTAQGRTDPNQNTGTSIQDCEIRASADLEPVKSSFPTYLGRPWKEYSRTVVMQSYIGDHVDPAGWAEWTGDFALKTLYYGEYMNRGPGAGTSRRVKWAGYRVITSATEASKFTVKELIQGGSWLSSSGVAYTEGL